jgi:hypothetical protein
MTCSDKPDARTGNRFSKDRNNSDPGTFNEAIRSTIKKSPDIKTIIERRSGSHLNESTFMSGHDVRGEVE